MAYCPSVCSYCVTFSDGTVMYPKIPGHVDVYKLANDYAKTLSKEKTVTVVSIQSMD